ncbi:hypothetical protein [Aquabacterium sp.]|uniref:hypothetical protein n=1 Tax=Aquabacterium sp. TaxID=1872578 RepID=UPI0035B41809
MTWFMHLAGSELREVCCEPGLVRLVFSAAWVQPERPVLGQGDQHAFHRGVTWRLDQAGIQGDVAAMRGRLTEGALTCAGRLVRAVSLPSCHFDGVTLTLVSAQGARLDIQAKTLDVQVEPGATCFESMAC